MRGLHPKMLDCWENKSQQKNKSSTYSDVHDPLHEGIIIQVNCIRINIMRIEIISHSFWAVKHCIVQYFHEDGRVTLECTASNNRLVVSIYFFKAIIIVFNHTYQKLRNRWQFSGILKLILFKNLTY